MRVEYKGMQGKWRDVADSARTTINLDAGVGEPSSHWKKRMLVCEHSPIRRLQFNWKWHDLEYWVSVHIVRHWLGIVHWVGTQRSDRTNVDRNEKLQSAMVMHEAYANPQAMINISRKRLCRQASKETRKAWAEVIRVIGLHEPEMEVVCVPDCIYRGHCFEYKTCGYYKTKDFEVQLEKYRRGIN